MKEQELAAAVDVPALEKWIDDNVGVRNGPLRVSHLSGGSSNLTLRIDDDSNSYVLRRPPLGAFLATANDMGREFKVQKGLYPTDVPVPKPVAFCESDDVIGAQFYLMEFLDGVVYTDAEKVAHLNEAQSRDATFALIDNLARVHAVDFEKVGLSDLGKPEGFVTRQVSRWCGQWEKSKQRDLPAIDELARRLERSIPTTSDSSIVHGDYSFNNTMWDRNDPTKMIAILDWEMSTLGDPLTDVGMVAVYWGAAGERMWRGRSPQPHRANPGFGSVDQLLARYEKQSGRAIDNIDFYQVLAVFKLAIITEGALARIRRTRPDESTAHVEQTIADLAAIALEIADSSSMQSLRGA